MASILAPVARRDGVQLLEDRGCRLPCSLAGNRRVVEAFPRYLSMKGEHIHAG